MRAFGMELVGMELARMVNGLALVSELDGSFFFGYGRSINWVLEFCGSDEYGMYSNKWFV